MTNHFFLFLFSCYFFSYQCMESDESAIIQHIVIPKEYIQNNSDEKHQNTFTNMLEHLNIYKKNCGFQAGQIGLVPTNESDKDYHKCVDKAFNKPLLYFQNFTITGMLNPKKPPIEMLNYARKNFVKRSIKYYGGPIKPRASASLEIVKKFKESTFGEMPQVEQQKNQESEMPCLIYSCYMKSLDISTKQERGYGFVFASGVNLESKDTEDYKLLESEANKDDETEKIIEERASMWIQAAIHQAKYQKDNFRKKKHIIVLPKIGLGFFGKCASSLGLSNIENIYYEGYINVIKKYKNELEENNIKIIFFIYPDKTSINNNIKKVLNDNVSNEIRNLYQIIEIQCSIYEISSWTNFINGYDQNEYSIIFIHAGDNHAYFNNGGLSDESMEMYACQWRSIQGVATNLIPFGLNICLRGAFHNQFGFWAHYCDEELEKALSVDKDIKWESIQNIFEKDYFEDAREEIKEYLKEDNTKFNVLLKDLQILTYSDPEGVKNYYKEKVPVYFGRPMTGRYSENNFHSFQKSIFGEGCNREKTQYNEGSEEVLEVLTGTLPNLAYDKDNKLPKEIFFCHTYGVNFESTQTPDYKSFEKMEKKDRADKFIDKTTQIFYLALKATFEKAISMKKRKIAIIWPRIGFGSFSKFIGNLFEIDQVRSSIDKDASARDMYKYLSILGYHKALKLILSEYDKEFDEIKILLSTLNYSASPLGDERNLCEKLYNTLMIKRFADQNKLKFTIGNKNIFDRNSEKVFNFLTENSQEYFYSFFHSGDPHSFVGNGGPGDSTLEGCMFGAHHVKKIDNPTILLPISVMNMIFFLFKKSIFEKFHHRYIKKIDLPKKEVDLKESKESGLQKTEKKIKKEDRSKWDYILFYGVPSFSFILFFIWIYKNRHHIFSF